MFNISGGWRWLHLLRLRIGARCEGPGYGIGIGLGREGRTTSWHRTKSFAGRRLHLQRRRAHDGRSCHCQVIRGCRRRVRLWYARCIGNLAPTMRLKRSDSACETAAICLSLQEGACLTASESPCHLVPCLPSKDLSCTPSMSALAWAPRASSCESQGW